MEEFGLTGVAAMEEKYDQPLAPIVESGMSDGTMPRSHIGSTATTNLSSRVTIPGTGTGSNKRDTLPQNLNTVISQNGTIVTLKHLLSKKVHLK